jgi:DME family drug/metabolite transporter
MSPRAAGIAFVLLAAVLWSTGGVGIKVVHAGVGVASGLSIGGWRCLFALPLLLAVTGPQALVRDGPRALRSPAVWGAAVSYALCVVTFAMATRLTTAATAILLQYTGPIYAALLSGPMLGERLRTGDKIAIGGTLVGMVAFTLDDLSADDRLGMALALISGVGFGALPVLLRRELLRPGAVAEASRIAIVLGNAIGVLCTLPFMVSNAPSDAASFGVLAALGTCQIAAAYLAYAAGLRRLRAVEASLLATAEPILNPVWVLAVTGEHPGAWALVGGLIIVVAVAVQQAWPVPQPATR